MARTEQYLVCLGKFHLTYGEPGTVCPVCRREREFAEHCPNEKHSSAGLGTCRDCQAEDGILLSEEGIREYSDRGN